MSELEKMMKHDKTSAVWTLTVPLGRPTLDNCMKLMDYVLGKKVGNGATATAYAACSTKQNDCKYVVKLLSFTEPDCVENEVPENRATSIEYQKLYEIEREFYFIGCVRKWLKKKSEQKAHGHYFPIFYGEYVCGSRAFIVAEKFDMSLESKLITQAEALPVYRSDNTNDKNIKIAKRDIEMARNTVRFLQSAYQVGDQRAKIAEQELKLQRATHFLENAKDDRVTAQMVKDIKETQQKDLQLVTTLKAQLVEEYNKPPMERIKADYKQNVTKLQERLEKTSNNVEKAQQYLRETIKYTRVLYGSQLSTIIEIIKYINSHGMVHGDIHFGNFLYKLDGQIAITDFGRSGDLKRFLPLMHLLLKGCYLGNLTEKERKILIQSYDIFYLFWNLNRVYGPKLGFIDDTPNQMYTFTKSKDEKKEKTPIDFDYSLLFQPKAGFLNADLFFEIIDFFNYPLIQETVLRGQGKW